MGGNSKTETVTKQDNTPWAPAQQPLQNVYSAAGTAYDATPKTGYGGSYLAPQSQSTILAQMMGQQLAGNSMGQGNQVAQAGKSLFDTWSSKLNAAGANAPTVSAPTIGDASVANAPQVNADLGTSAQFSDYINQFMNSTGDPAKLQGALNAMLQPIQQNLQEKIIPQAKLNAVGSGVYGGDSNDIAMRQGINDNYTQAATNAAGTLTYQDWANRMGLGAQGAGDYFNRSLTQGTTNAGLTMQQLMKNVDLLRQQQMGNADYQWQAGSKNADLDMQLRALLPQLSQSATGIQDAFTKSISDAYSLNALPIDTMTQIGTAQDQYQNDVVQANYKKWLDQLQAPWQGLEQYRGAITGYPTSSTGTSSGTSSGGGLF